MEACTIPDFSSRLFRKNDELLFFNYLFGINAISNIKLHVSHFLKPAFKHINISDFIVIFKLIEAISIETVIGYDSS